MIILRNHRIELLLINVLFDIKQKSSEKRKWYKLALIIVLEMKCNFSKESKHHKFKTRISPNLSCCLLLSIDVSTSHSWNRWPSASIWFILDHFPGLIRHPSPKALSMNFFLHFVTILMFLEIILYPTSVSKGVV